MAFRKPVEEDPRFTRASKYRQTLEAEFPQLRALDSAKLAPTGPDAQSIRKWVDARVSQALLGQEDEVLSEMICALLFRSEPSSDPEEERIDAYQLLELLEPFIGKKDAHCFVVDTFQFIRDVEQKRRESEKPVVAVAGHYPPPQVVVPMMSAERGEREERRRSYRSRSPPARDSRRYRDSASSSSSRGGRRGVVEEVEDWQSRRRQHRSRNDRARRRHHRSKSPT